MTTPDLNEQAVCDIINQRNQLSLLIPPPIRYNPISPYPANTQAELDMRRKAEILQFNKNSTQKGKITKAGLGALGLGEGYRIYKDIAGK